MPAPQFDLQLALSAMADYPALLKRLGVIRIIEVDLDGSGINPAMVGPVTVSALPTWPTKLPPSQVKKAPVEVPAVLTSTRFALTADGRLDPTAAQLDLLEIDSDSAAIRLVDLARQIHNANKANAAALAKDPEALLPVDTPEQLALPSLRNAGLSLIQGNRAVDLNGALKDTKPLQTVEAPHKLDDARHAMKGFVVDVWDDHTGRWHTLCARIGTYHLPGGVTFTIPDEGTVSLGATARPNAEADGTAALFLHQSLLRWTGWSLVAPRPGTPVQTETPGTQPSGGEPALPGFTVDFVPQPGTLPQLRFGRGYRFQLRTVDVAGGADTLNPTSTDFSRAVPPASQPPAKHLRFEPVNAPTLVPNAPMTEGESLETLVVRPEPGVAGQVDAKLAHIFGTPPVRHVAPAKVNVGLCEQHGCFDTDNGRPDPALYATIAQRDAATLNEVGTPDPNRPGQRFFDGDQLPVTWFGDPISRGAAIAGLPTGLLQVRFDPPRSGSWPDVQAFRLQVADGTTAPSWDDNRRILTVFVPRGEMRTVRLSSFLDPADAGLLGLLDWLARSGKSPETIAAVVADVLAGQAWQVTPYRTLNLVNAVRVPVTVPVLNSIDPPSATAPREPDSTKADLKALATVHRPSTGKLSLLARWTDPVDDPGNPAGPTTADFTASPNVGVDAPDTVPGPELAVDYDPDPVTGTQVAFNATHVFGDTRRHQVRYSVVGTTRYMEYFVQRGLVTLTGTTPLHLSLDGIVPGTDAVRSADGATTYRRDADYTVNYETGSIARLTGGAIGSGDTVEVALVAPPVTQTSAPPVLVDHRSTAPPAAPQVAWIVPTFGWTETDSKVGPQTMRTRVRSGGGLRVFLDRPWYSSGVGEQLAVVLANGTVDTNDLQLTSILTQLGADPVVDTDGQLPGRFPTPQDFPLAADRRPDLTPAGLAGRKVAIAAHDVVFDAERKRWACDIVLPPALAYQPFVHLILARYQPHSLEDLELSPVAEVEWVQLSANRSATVTFDPHMLTKATVTVVGRSPKGTAAKPNEANAVSVIIQTAGRPEPGDLDWKTVAPAAGQPLAFTTQPDGTTTWTGTVTLPTNKPIRPYRLVITEHEQYDGGSRLVYSDVIRL